uniref:FP protein C-terminal domain-containing protein n=1 Tax=Cacopsylla melanoneura TaxID=428564 RepID=A0A8D8Y759_9HEMI
MVRTTKNSQEDQSANEYSLIVQMSKDVKKLNSIEEKLNKVLKVVDEQGKEIKKLKTQLAELKEENINLKNDNEENKNHIHDMQQRQRLINIIVDGIPVTKNENVYNIIKDLGTKLGIQDPLNDVQVCHRVNTTNKRKPKPIVVRMLNTKTRDQWTAAYRVKKLWTEKIYVNEHLTARNQRILKEAKKAAKEKKFKFVWVKDCKIFVRKDETSKIYNMRSLTDVEQILNVKIRSEEDLDSSSASSNLE